MKPYHLKDLRTYLPPYKRELAEMLHITRERTVILSHGVHGFILGNKVLAPYHYNESVIGSKDGHDIVLTFQKVDKWGISHFLLPFDMPCEPLHFRHEPLHKDSYFFRVYRHVTLCSGFAVENKKGKYGMDAPDQFCPVFDRKVHLLGIVSGVFRGNLLCVPITEIV